MTKSVLGNMNSIKTCVGRSTGCFGWRRSLRDGTATLRDCRIALLLTCISTPWRHGQKQGLGKVPECLVHQLVMPAAVGPGWRRGRCGAGRRRRCSARIVEVRRSLWAGAGSMRSARCLLYESRELPGRQAHPHVTANATAHHHAEIIAPCRPATTCTSTGPPAGGCGLAAAASSGRWTRSSTTTGRELLPILREADGLCSADRGAQEGEEDRCGSRQEECS
jgi:hypothetical protein